MDEIPQMLMNGLVLILYTSEAVCGAFTHLSKGTEAHKQGETLSQAI